MSEAKPHETFSLDCFILEDGTEKQSRNVGNTHHIIFQNSDVQVLYLHSPYTPSERGQTQLLAYLWVKYKGKGKVDPVTCQESAQGE
jgi:hypothetical protein